MVAAGLRSPATISPGHKSKCLRSVGARIDRAVEKAIKLSQHSSAPHFHPADCHFDGTGSLELPKSPAKLDIMERQKKTADWNLWVIIQPNYGPSDCGLRELRRI
ncbi:unnamed protein product [Protopolystoma xenopodis]|uniref:Uncharacterized protein n=1 Tax=Protopolystoma xenopodis TaxID=117903 RepID=A0A448XLD2_9PLAT|nr:unnamed protein product [Protopolystoma xenopodis]